MIRIVGTRGVLEIITIFVIVLAVGMLIAVEAIKTSSVYILYNTFANPRFTLFSYFLDATIALIIALLIIRRHKHHSNTLLFDALEGIVTSLTSFFVFLILLAILMPTQTSGDYIYVLSAVIAVLLVMLKYRWHRLRDFDTIVSSIGVGLVLGFNLPLGYAISLLAIVAVYDYILVFKTKDMISMARAFAARDISFLISVSDLEAVPKWGLSEKEIDTYMDCLKRTHELDDPRFQKILHKGELPVLCQVSLGEGDLSLPLMAVISAYMTMGQLLSAVALLGSLVGIIVTMLILKMYKHPIPAMPPLFACIGVFVGVAFIASQVASLYSVGALLIVAGTAAMFIDMITILRRMHSSMKNS